MACTYMTLPQAILHIPLFGGVRKNLPLLKEIDIKSKIVNDFFLLIISIFIATIIICFCFSLKDN